MKFDLLQVMMQFTLVFLAAMIASVNSVPITLIKGTPYLFNKYDYPVDPNRGSQLAPAFQAANGPFGANLVNYFGTGNL